MLSMINNFSANNTNRNISNQYKDLSDSIKKLSSGLRITTAADDAAGLAVSEMMRADAAAMLQGLRNANDGISVIQTADGALQGINENLVRMKELATQASNGTYTAEQRAIIDIEYQALADEVNRISAATEFNGQKLLDGSLSSEEGGDPMRIHFGASNESTDYHDLDIPSMSADSLGVGDGAPAGSAGANVLTQEGASNALQSIENAIVSLAKVQGHVGAMSNRLDSTVANIEIEYENTVAAEARIRDVDVATEMTNFTKNQILLQSSTAMASHSNSLMSYTQALFA